MDDVFDLRHAFPSSPELLMVKNNIGYLGKNIQPKSLCHM